VNAMMGSHGTTVMGAGLNN